MQLGTGFTSAGSENGERVMKGLCQWGLSGWDWEGGGRVVKAV